MDFILPSPERPPSPGYVSPGARRKFAWTAAPMLLVYLAINLSAPFLLVLSMARPVPRVAVSGRSWPHVWDAVLWKGSLWYIQESLPRSMSPREQATLQKLDLGGKKAPVTVSSAFLEDPRLLASPDRLWIISPEDVRYVKGGRMTDINVGWRLGDITPPFLLNGRPAVFEQRPAGVTLTVLRGGHWERGPLVDLEAGGSGDQPVPGLVVLPCNGRYHLFMKTGATLYYRQGLPGREYAKAADWEPVVDSNTQWSVACAGGEPELFRIQSDFFRDILAIYQRGDRGWFSRKEVPLDSWRAAVGVVPAGNGADLYLLYSGPDGGVGLGELQGGKLEERGAYYREDSGPTFGRFRRNLLRMLAVALVLPVIFALILSGLMSRWRIPGYFSASATARLAALWRRGLAQVIDALILGGPMAAGFLLVMLPLLLGSRGGIPSNPIPGLLLILAGAIWALGVFLVLCLLEGRLGATPGKWILGIRVLGADLRPSGFPRALVRNLLKAVDGCFSFLVGLGTAAFSRNWQRLGDLAARTVVIRAGSIRLPQAASEGQPSPPAAPSYPGPA